MNAKTITGLCPLAQTCRHFTTSLRLHKKPNIQRPRVRGIERRILNAVTVPIFPADSRPLPQRCFEAEQERVKKHKSELTDAYNAFRRREVLRMLTNHQMVAICHALPVSDRENKALKAAVITSFFQLIYADNNLAKEAIQHSKFVNLTPYMASTNAYVCSEKVNVAELVKMLRKTPSLVLLGGVVDDRILSRDQILSVAKLPPLDTLRGELLTVLNASASKTTRLLGRHGQDLSSNLSQLVRQGSEGEGQPEVPSRDEGATS